ncbi:ABC-type dipeptide transport system, periplasmic component [Saccharomonospora marina XMU15]|uniref:ABC-type dipeptide transport system, periplasmic component n=1 Tax=Saccharomonospora marina XMU15 TaxID=882083 RepID=H5X7Q7_9PSEU|nr:ABC transporter substrate-binding protein [Saccharomonospora marina]EHR51350.1 ABC-type dipeptide transport system, periplasmic component [Saccharomonospora marina XMU15]
MKSVLTIATAGVLAVTLAACAGSGGAQGGQNFVDGKTFTMVLGTDPGNLDPHFSTLSVTMQVNRFLYDPLLHVDENGELVAGLAGQWEASTTEATFTLRDGLSCADGRPLTATTVADNINFVGDVENAAAVVGLYVPPGAKATADDAARTVTVAAPSPDPFLARNIGSLPIVCERGLDNRDLLKQGGAGTGMFTVTEAVAGDHYTLDRREDYAWGPGDWKPDQRGLPDKVVLRVVPNETTAANLLASGEVNAGSVIGPDRRRLEAQQLLRRDVVAVLGELWFNQKPGMPAEQAQVRRALTQALDLSELANVITGGMGEPPSGLVATGMGPCEDAAPSLPEHDAEAAAAALDEAGWTPGPGGIRTKDGKRLSMTLYYPSKLGAPMQSAAELVQRSWRAVGVEVELRGGPDTQVEQVVAAGQGTWHAAFLPLNVTLPTQLVPFLSGATPPEGNNFSFIDNPDYTAAVERASQATGADGCDSWAEAEQAVVGDLDVVPFANTNRPLFAGGATFVLTEGSVAPSSIRMLG